MADLSPELTARIQSLEGSYADNPGRYFVALAGAWREAGEIGRAEEILRENLKRFPGLSAHVLLGRCLADRGAYQEAANEFHYVLSIDAQNLIALRTLAEMAASTGRRAEAERWYNELLAVDPMNAEARAALQELARGGADAAVADQPVQVGTGWGGAAERLDVAGGADAEGADEFGMIDLSSTGPSAADASGVAADDDAAEWGDLPFDIPSTSAASPASAAPSPADDFDAFGFGSVDLDTRPAAGSGADETGTLDAWMDADARQDLGESAAADRGALAPLEDDTLLNAPVAGTDLPFLDADDTVDAGAAGFPGFDAPSHGDGFGGFAAPLPTFDADPDDADHADHPVDAEVVTETMAELYAAQGLLHQSADTYRELIRRRGEEPGLVRRLAEIEARLNLAAGTSAPAPAEDEAPDWLASVDAFAMGGAAASLAAVHMSAEPPPEPVDTEPEAAAGDAVGEPAPFADFSAVDASYLPADGADATVADFAADQADAAVSGFAPAAPAESASEAGDAYADTFADSFAGGFEGVEAAAPRPEPAFAVVPDDADREAWEAPSIRETEPVGFDLIVVEEDGETVAAPPEVVADVSADWAIAAAPLEDDEEAAEAEVPLTAAPRAGTMSAYFSSLLAWQPGQSAASAVAEPPAPAYDAVPAVVEPATDDTPWTHTAATAEPVAADEPWGASADAGTSAAEPPQAGEPWGASADIDATPAAESADEPWGASAAEEEPWAGTPAAPVYDDAPSAGPAVAEDDPWAAPAKGAPRAGPSGDIPLFDLDAADPWAQAPRDEPPSIDAFELSDEIARPAAPAAEEALPWELPADPAAAQEPARGGAELDAFSFEDFFAGGGAPAPAQTPAPAPARTPEPQPELPPSLVPTLAFEPEAPVATPAPPAPAAPAANAPAGGQDEDDEDLESFQAWLQSLKR